MRSVAYAACYLDDVARDLATLRPALVVYDTFAMVARLAARRLGLSYVNVCAGHNVEPGRFQRILADDPRVVISAACRAGVTTLRERHGERDASPYAYVAGTSPWLNVVAEPPEFLTADERRTFEPIAFFGSLPDAVDAQPAAGSGSAWTAGAAPRIYVSLGTTAWRSYAPAVLAALQAIADAVASRPRASALLSLGGARLAAGDVARLARPNVRVEQFVDQRAVLREADVFVTHHGLNSTHESVWQRVPMVSYPLFWDQPDLAARCQALGLAVPLGTGPRAPVTPADVLAALDRVERERGALAARLTVARDWELAVMARRGEVLERMLCLARSGERR
jgi:UDP:flavonoid glycosyltransferase YjiC (YdhE family)